MPVVLAFREDELRLGHDRVPPCAEAASARPSGCGRLARRAIFRFTETPNQWLNLGRPVPTRGAVARRHERGMGCGGRESVGAPLMSQGELNLVSDLQARKTNDVLAYGKTVWS
jgi:hypothetical protein